MNGAGDYNVSNITYDANGNIQSLHRNKDKHQGRNTMDQLSYVYKTDKPNQLLRVDDAVTTATNADDIKDQDGENYVYNEIGQLIENKEEKIKYFYNASGLVSEVQKNGSPLVTFFYNDKGFRVRKEHFLISAKQITFYVRDASGQTLAMYSQQISRSGGAVRLTEHTIHGASRLGIQKSDGTNLYQLTDHLGNVRAVVGRNPEGEAMALTSATDYYPFGMTMPNRNQQGDYRYGYQGEYAEKEPELGNGVNSFELRMYDSRIGRWVSPDPAQQYFSPYLAMGNNGVNAIDPDGGYVYIIGGDPTLKKFLSKILATPIGQEVLKEYVNNPHKHLHIGFGPDTNIKQTKVNAVAITSQAFEVSNSITVESVSNVLSEKFSSHYLPFISGTELQKGDNRFVLLNAFTKNSEDRQTQSLFHEITAHNYLTDLTKGNLTGTQEHLIFSQHPKGHQIPGNIGASLLDHFLHQFNNQFTLFHMMQFNTVRSSSGSERVLSDRFFKK